MANIGNKGFFYKRMTQVIDTQVIKEYAHRHLTKLRRARFSRRIYRANSHSVTEVEKYEF